MAREVMTVRLDRPTRVRLKVAAKRRHLTPSAAARLAVDKWLDDEDATVSIRPYELIKDLVGSVSGGDRLRSSRSSRAIADILKKRDRAGR
jgi:hypothetical protein